MSKRSNRLFRTILAGCAMVICCLALSAGPARAQRSVPPCWDIVAEDFESGSLDAWGTIGSSGLSLAPAGGQGGSAGLAVTARQSQSYIYQTDVARAEEGYLSFWFDPNSVDIPNDASPWWLPGRSVRVADVKGPSWNIILALWVHQPTSDTYSGYLQWHDGSGSEWSYETGEFPLIDAGQRITIGYAIDQWVAAWVDGELVQEITATVHGEPYGEIVEIGKANTSSHITPTGSLRYDDVNFGIPRIADLWVDGESGDDESDGLTPASALATIQHAATLAGPGTTVHIQPGIYRESVRPALDGTAAEPVVYRPEQGPGTAILRGAEPSSALTWTQLTTDPIGLPAGVAPTALWVADLSAWGLSQAPRFIVQLDVTGQISSRLPLAREPDWEVVTDWKHHEYWWAADGGHAVAACDPRSDPDPMECDTAQRSLTQLTDRSAFTESIPVEPGDLTTLGDLVSGTLVAIDGRQGHYVYRRTIVDHDVGAGTITVDEVCEHDSGSNKPGLAWGTKYYVENLPQLIDTPGEWWYDVSTGRLYLWPLTPGDPGTQSLEISRLDNGLRLAWRSYLLFEDLTLDLYNETAVSMSSSSSGRAAGNTVRNAVIRYANVGVAVTNWSASGALPQNVVDGFTLEDSEVGHIDTYGVTVAGWWEGGEPSLFHHSGVVSTTIRNNELHHLGFRTDRDNAVGGSFQYIDRLRFEGNHVHHVAHNGMQFSRSVIQADVTTTTYGFQPHEIRTGDILIRDNIFEKACQLTTDCGALKFWGDPPDSHVFRDVLITGNVFRKTYGWTYVSEQRDRWRGGSASDIVGMGGFGLYVDMASGIHAYRNVAYDTARTGFMFAGVWRDGDIILVNNVAANSLAGISLSGLSFDTHGAVNTQVLNNIILNNEGFGIEQADADGIYAHMTFDHNLYYNNGWRPWDEGGLWCPGAMIIYRDIPNECYQTMAEIQAGRGWEPHGVASDPRLQDYTLADHDVTDASWPDLHLTAPSPAIDGGQAPLPTSLSNLLTHFGVTDLWLGAAPDIGRYEYIREVHLPLVLR